MKPFLIVFLLLNFPQNITIMRCTMVMFKYIYGAEEIYGQAAAASDLSSKTSHNFSYLDVVSFDFFPENKDLEESTRIN